MNCFKCDKYLIKYLVLNNKVYNALCEYCYLEEKNLSTQQINNDDTNKCLLCDKEIEKANLCKECFLLMQDYEHEIPKETKDEGIRFILNTTRLLLRDIDKLKDENDKLKTIIKKKLLHI